MRVTSTADPTRPVVGVQATVRVDGVADPAATVQAAATIRSLIAAGVRDLVVDVSAARAVGPEMLTVLAWTDAELNGGAGSFRLVGVALPEFDAALQDAALDEVFMVYGALRAGPPAVSAPRTDS